MCYPIQESVLLLLLRLCVCVLVHATYRVPKSEFYSKNEDILAVCHKFKGQFQGENMRIGFSLG